MKIKFLPQNIEVEGSSDKSLLQIATENHLEIRSICKGVPSCAECRVRIKEGDNNILPPNKAELSLIGTSYFIDGRRLSCQVHCFGDVTVDLTEQVERQENQTKKIRGFRSNKPMESKAVNDMMLMNEKEEVKDSSGREAKDAGDSSPANEPKEQRPAREHKPQQHNRQQNQNKPQQQQQNKGQQQQRPPQQQAQGKGQQQQGNRPPQQGKSQQPQQPRNQQQNQQQNQQPNRGQQNAQRPKK